MDHPISEYYALTKNFMMIIGQWPYQSKCEKLVGKTIAISIVSLNLCFVLLKFISTNLDPAFIINGMSIAVLAFVGLLSIISLYIYEDKLKILMDKVKCDWVKKKSKQEEAIIREYAEESKQSSQFFLVYIVTCFLLMIPVTYITHILDKIWPLNETRYHPQPFEYEFFIDDQENFSTVFFASYFMLVGGAFIMIANSSLFLICIYHICGKFAILGYHLEHMYDVAQVVREKDVLPLNKVIHQKICYCIQMHKDALEFAAVFNSFYGPSLFFLLAGSIVQTSFTLAQLSNLEISRLRDLCYGMGQMILFGASAYVGQQLLDISSDLSYRAYASSWYEGPPALRKFLIVIIQRSQNPCSINAYNIYVLSLETFQTFIQMYVSYCMMIRKFRNN